MPMTSAMANSLSVTAPKPNEPTSNTINTGNTDVIVVFIERMTTWLSDKFMMSSYPTLPANDGRTSFSWTRSNTTKVSYNE